MRDGIVVTPDTSLESCLALLRSHKIGSVMIAGDDGKLVGIFTERDWILKVGGDVADLTSEPVSKYMTVDPTRERADATIAFALNLMSYGGFRHLPVVDEHDMPVGIVSVKDVVDLMVERMMTSLVDACQLSAL
jgi:CBS domain-containing protein